MRRIALASLVGVAVSAGFAPDAHAEFTLRNDTNEAVVFDLQCRNGSYDTWSIGAHRSETYHCANGAQVALLEIYTDDEADDEDDGDDFVVSDEIQASGSYAFFRDAVGYVEVVRFR
jgi:hypothetical protein